MVMGFVCRFPCWPLRPWWDFEAGITILAIAGAVFSLVMLIDCLKRPPAKFHNPLTKKGEYDKLIWAVAILLSLYFYFIGPVAYFFVVKRGKPEKTQ